MRLSLGRGTTREQIRRAARALVGHSARWARWKHDRIVPAFGAFVVGLLGLRGVELVAPDHTPTAPLGTRWLANLGFGAVNGVIVSLACASCYVFSARGEFAAYLGPLRRLGLSTWTRIPLEIVLLDLVAYLLHRAYHVVPLFWRFHVVHHSDLDLDVSSASRFHMGEVLVSSIVKIGAVVLVSGISPQGFVAFETVMLAGAQFQHANVRLPGRLESGLWWTFVPPAMHRIHHTPTIEDTNSNYGTILTVSDWLLGSLRRRPPDPKPSFGVETLRHPRVALGREAPRAPVHATEGLRLGWSPDIQQWHAFPASGLGRPEIDADGAKRAGARRLRSAVEDRRLSR